MPQYSYQFETFMNSIHVGVRPLSLKITVDPCNGTHKGTSVTEISKHSTRGKELVRMLESEKTKPDEIALYLHAKVFMLDTPVYENQCNTKNNT